MKRLILLTIAGEQLPQGYRRSLPRDAIFPVYDPSFIAANEINWSDDILVIGVDLEGEARAYPVGFLNRREIVIDDHLGIPTLVTDLRNGDGPSPRARRAGARLRKFRGRCTRTP